MARPAKDPSELLAKPVSFRLRKKDYETWMNKVSASGMTEADFFRAAVINNETQVVARQRASGDKKRLLFISNKASNNINQIAHRVNADAQAGLISEQAYMDVLYELQQLNLYFKATLSNVD